MSNIVKVLTVSDIHRDKTLYRLLDEAVTIHRPDVVAFVGDFLDASEDGKHRLTTEECGRVLSRLKCPETIFVRGNHEDSAWWQFSDSFRESGRELHLLEGSTFTYGPLVIVGFPCLMNQGDGIGNELPIDPNRWLPKLLRPHLPASRTLWLMHEPPYGTPLSARSGPLSGQIEWREAIERFLPRAVVCGHDHETTIRNKQWSAKIGPTTCINVGQSERGPLHYTLIQFGFGATSLSLPKTVKVSRFPNGQTITL